MKELRGLAYSILSIGFMVLAGYAIKVKQIDAAMLCMLFAIYFKLPYAGEK